MPQCLRKACLLPSVLLILTFAQPTHSATLLTATVADSGGRPIENAVVYATPFGSPTLSPKSRGAVVNQLDREFVPFLTVVQVGTLVRFPNNDPMLHHVYSFSPAKTFQIKLNADTAATPILFDKPGAVALGCNIHDWMEAHIFVVESPYFAQTDAHGVARIANIEHGSYILKVWHPYQRTSAPTQSLQAKSGSPATASFMVDINTPRQKPKPPVEKDLY